MKKYGKVWESIDNKQIGFWKNKSTQDNISKLQNIIKQYVNK